MSHSIEKQAQAENVYISKLTLAARLEVSPRTLENWVAKQLIPCVKIGHTVRFNWTAVQSHLEKSKPVIKSALLPRTTDKASRQRLDDLARDLRKQG